MTIKEFYEWAVQQGLENNPVVISTVNGVKPITNAELIKKDDIFNGILYNVEPGTIILK